MKILIFSDFHLHNWPYGSKLVNGMNSRLKAQADVFDRLAKYIEENEVDHIVFCGDLFHTHGKIDATVLKVAYEGITKIMAAAGMAPMDMLVGNHDTDRKDLSVHDLHWLNSIPGVRVVDRPTHERTFSFLPYTEDVEVLKKFFAEAGKYCFMHQGMVDVPMASGWVVNEILNYDMIPKHVRHIFTGHYHPFRAVGIAATVVGSVMQHTWADMGDTRGWLIFDTNTGNIVQINSRAPEFRTLGMGGCAALGATFISGNAPSHLNNNYVRVKNFSEGSIERLRKEILAQGAASVEFVIKAKNYRSNVVKAISGKGLSVPELVREYEKEHSVSEDRRNVGKELMK